MISKRLFGALIEGMKQWMSQTEVVSGYVFEPQRKAAIGYFQVRMCRKGEEAHVATLTVHPAYTWLYPELLSQLARIAQDLPPCRCNSFLRTTSQSEKSIWSRLGLIELNIR